MPLQSSLFTDPDAAPLVLAGRDTVLLMLDKSRLGMARKVDLKKLPNVSDELRNELVSATARILDCTELKAIASLDGQVSAMIRRYSLPSIFRWGAYLVTADNLSMVDAKLSEFGARRGPLVDTFVETYDAITEAARTQLGPKLAAAINWPDPDYVSRLFSFRWRWIQLALPATTLGSVDTDGELLVREVAKFDEDDTRQTILAQQALRREFRKLATTIVERLSPDDPDVTDGILVEPGKPKRFQDSLVTNMTDFITEAPSRAFTDDPQLERLLVRTNILLSDVTPAVLRGDETIRLIVKRGLELVLAELQPLIIEAPTRRIRLLEDSPSDEALATGGTDLFGA